MKTSDVSIVGCSHVYNFLHLPQKSLNLG